jgi:hypothetical protein
VPTSPSTAAMPWKAPRELDLRANIIVATEKRVDDKIGQLKALRPYRYDARAAHARRWSSSTAR